MPNEYRQVQLKDENDLAINPINTTHDVILEGGNQNLHTYLANNVKYTTNTSGSFEPEESPIYPNTEYPFLITDYKKVLQAINENRGRIGNILGQIYKYNSIYIDGIDYKNADVTLQTMTVSNSSVPTSEFIIAQMISTSNSTLQDKYVAGANLLCLMRGPVFSSTGWVTCDLRQCRNGVYIGLNGQETKEIHLYGVSQSNHYRLPFTASMTEASSARAPITIAQVQDTTSYVDMATSGSSPVTFQSKRGENYRDWYIKVTNNTSNGVHISLSCGASFLIL